MSRRERWLPLGVLAAAVSVPLLLTEPGRVGADTKSYLYLDPSRLLSRAWSMWDPSIGLGTVSHQNLGYLWPMGPWYWTFEQLGVPDWVAQRLWLASILFAAGAGTLWLLRRVLGWATAPAVAAAFVYALTPYVLTLAARISVILLPFAGLPWLIGMTALALRDPKRWRWPAGFALVVTTVGSVNATALVLAGLGPVLWLLHARVAGEATTPAVLHAALRIGVLTVAVNLWWIAGLWAQGGYGIEILRYTETAEVVASAAVAAEVLRGLGYWFFYGGDRLGPWIEPGAQYTQRLPLLGLTYAIPLVAFLAGAVVRWRERAYFVALLAVGVVAAVGAHPWDDPPPGGEAVKAFLGSDVGLAMRSLPRAAPLVVLALAALLGAGVGALAARWRWPAAVAVALAAYLALPPLWTGGMVASNLDRDEELPAYWLDAAAALDAAGDATRVLAVPGADFASYRWGNTVDPILPGLVDRPYVARELIPYGSPASADLLGALDRQLQEDVLAPGALGAVARLLGVGDVLHRGDLQFERFRTPRPYDLAPRLGTEPGLGSPVGFGAPVVNEPVAAVPLVDELALLADDRRPRPPVEVYPVTDALAIVRAEPARGGIVLAGDGEGLVDAAGAGLVDGDDLLRYGASLGRDGVAAALDDGAVLVVTDGNRRQGRRWSTVRDTLGYVEPPAALEEDLADNRLPVFPDAEPGWETTAEAAVRAAATTYGNPTSFTPEYRPANAVDGDVRTEWRTAANRDIAGERLELTFDPPVEASTVTLVQQLSGARSRHIAEVDVRVNGGDAQRVALGEASLTPEGQEVALDVAGGGPVETLSIELVADSTGRSPSWGRPLRYTGASQVGFAEVRVGDAGGPEALRLPPAATGSIDSSSPVALVLTRWRTDAAEALRDDPEPALRRAWSQPVARTFELSGTVRPSPRAPDETLDAALGTSGAAVTASSRLPGAVSERASAAFDGDATTWWSPRFGDPEPAVTYTAPAPVTIDRVDVSVLDDGRRSVPTAIRVEADGVPVATVAPGETVLDAPVTAASFRFVVEAVDERRFVDWYSNAPVATPPAILEIDAPGLGVDRPESLDGGCRDDLVALDGAPVPVRIAGDRVEGCEPVEVGAGEHLLATPAGRDTGIDVDQLVLTSGDVVPVAGEAPAVTVVDQGRPSVRVRIDGATPGEPFWLVLGQSYNEGWALDGRAPELVNGYSAGWLVTPDAESFELEAVWQPQRVVNVALVVSALAAVLCLALLPTRSSAHRPDVVRSSGQRTWAVAVVATVGALVWIGPVSAVVVAAFAIAYPRAPRVLVLGPAAAFATAAGYVLARQAIAQPGAAFEWPAELATAHEPALVAVALLAVVVATPTRRGGDAPASAPSDAASP